MDFFAFFGVVHQKIVMFFRFRFDTVIITPPSVRQGESNRHKPRHKRQDQAWFHAIFESIIKKYDKDRRENEHEGGNGTQYNIARLDQQPCEIIPNEWRGNHD